MSRASDTALLSVALLAFLPPLVLAIGVLMRLDFDFYETLPGHLGWSGTVFVTPVLGLTATVWTGIAVARRHRFELTTGLAIVAGLLALALGVAGWFYASKHIWPT